MEKYKIKILEYLFKALMLFLPLSLFLDNVVLIIFSVIVVVFGYARSISFKGIINYSLIPFFVYIMLIGLCFGTFKDEIPTYIKILPLVIIPICSSFYKSNEKLILEGLIFLFIGVSIVQIISIYGIGNYYLFFEGKKRPLRSYAGINEILFFERPYLGYFSSLAAILAYFILKKKSILVMIISIIISFSIVIVISARMGFLIIFFSLIITLFFELSKKKRIVFTLVVIIGSILIVRISDIPLKHRFIQIKHDSRMIIWEGALKLYEESPSYMFGYANRKQIKSKLIDYYENRAFFEYEPDKIRFLKHKYNTHNQYLGVLLHGGFLGLLLLVFPIFNCLYSCITKRQLLKSLLLLSIIFFLFVENLLARQIGVYIVAIVLSITQKINDDKII